MTFTLEVVLEGICSLVPDSPFFARDEAGNPVPGNPSQVTVLLPDLRQPGLASWSTASAPVFRASHWPILSFDLVAYDPASTRAIDLVTKDLGSGQERGVILLDHEYITLAPPPGPRSFKPDLTVPKKLDYPDLSPDSQELTSLWWVPQMLQLSQAFAKAGRANDPAGPDFRFGLNNSLIGALNIDQGLLSVQDFNRVTLGGQINSWDFGFFQNQTRTVVCRRAIGNQLALEVAGFQDPVELTLTYKSQGSGPMDSQLVLRPPAGSRNPTVEVRFGNVEPETLRAEGTPFKVTAVGADPDFEPLCGLCTVPPQTPIPVPLFREGGLGRVDKPCTPSMSQSF